MDIYTAHVIAHLEHEERIREAERARAFRAASVSEPRWTGRQLRRLLNAAGNALIAVGKRLTPQDGDIQHPTPQRQHAG